MKKILKAIVDTIKDPDLLSSRPHHGDFHPETGIKEGEKGYYGKEGNFTGQRLVCSYCGTPIN